MSIRKSVMKIVSRLVHHLCVISYLIKGGYGEKRNSVLGTLSLIVVCLNPSGNLCLTGQYFEVQEIIRFICYLIVFGVSKKFLLTPTLEKG